MPRLNLAHLVRPAHGERASMPAEGAPGLLLLHGRGADEADLMGLEAALDPRLVVVSARAPFGLGKERNELAKPRSGQRQRGAFAWYDMAQIGDPDEETFNISLDELREFIDGLPATYGIDPRRLYLMGFSQGAIMSAALGLTVPDKVRGIIMHSGYVPVNLVRDQAPGGIKGKGFFVAHGLYDEVIPVNYGRDSQSYLSAQGARLTYNEYPIGHGISEESLYDLSEWLSQELEG